MKNMKIVIIYSLITNLYGFVSHNRRDFDSL